MHEQVADRRARLGGRAAAVVAVAAGDGMRDALRGPGRAVVDGGPTLTRRPRTCSRRSTRARRRRCSCCPNSRNVILAAEEAAQLADNRPAVVVLRRSQQAGARARWSSSTRGDADENAERMRGRRSSDPRRRRRPGGPRRRRRAASCAATRSASSATRSSPGAAPARPCVGDVGALAEDAEIVTVIEGAEAPIPLSELDLELPTAPSSSSTTAASRITAG